jgi:hypothetical protein
LQFETCIFEIIFISILPYESSVEEFISLLNQFGNKEVKSVSSEPAKVYQLSELLAELKKAKSIICDL